eukprot:3689143-Rhodomonas_salina.2
MVILPDEKKALPTREPPPGPGPASPGRVLVIESTWASIIGVWLGVQGAGMPCSLPPRRKEEAKLKDGEAEMHGGMVGGVRRRGKDGKTGGERRRVASVHAVIHDNIVPELCAPCTQVQTLRR